MFPRCHLAALRDGAIDGKIDAVGGFHGRELETVEVYDPQADSWQRVASMPQCLCDHAAAAVGGKIYVTGGESDREFWVKAYDPQADAWTQLASMGTVRKERASAAVGGKLYVFGGRDGEGHLSKAEVYDPACVGQLGAGDELDFRAPPLGGGRPVSTAPGIFPGPLFGGSAVRHIE